MGTVANCVLGALGALGRRFESCRPDWLLTILKNATGEERARICIPFYNFGG